MEINYTKQIKLLLITTLLLLTATPHATTEGITPIIAIDNVEFTSSHWEEAEIRDDFEMVQNYRSLKVVEDETFTADIELKNVRRFFQTANASLRFQYSGIVVDKYFSVNSWQMGSVLTVTVQNLPAPSFMDWSDAKLIIDWQIDLINEIKSHSHEIPIVPKGKNFKATIPNVVDHNNVGQENDHLGLNTHVGDVLDIWEGSSSTKSTLTKGQGPSAKVKIKFNSDVLGGFYIEYKMKGKTHNNWISSYTHYWSGNFYSGQTWTLTLGFGWNFDNSKYVFGQGEYEFYSATAYNGWTDTEYRDATEDDFSVTQSTGDHVVFLAAIYDTYVTSNHNCLDRSASQFVNDAVNDFESVFAIDYLITLKQVNWLGSHGGLHRIGISLCGGIGEVKVADESNSGLRTASINGLESAYGLAADWNDDPSGTRKGNHGFDQSICLTGLLRAHNSGHGGTVGQAGTPGNHGWVTAGTEYAVLGVPVGWTVVGDSAYDNLVQHEMSHNWGAQHDNSNNNVMKETSCNCSNWNSKAQGEFIMTQFDGVPTA